MKISPKDNHRKQLLLSIILVISKFELELFSDGEYMQTIVSKGC